MAPGEKAGDRARRLWWTIWPIRSYLMENDFLVSVAGTLRPRRSRSPDMVLDTRCPVKRGLKSPNSRGEKRNVPIAGAADLMTVSSSLPRQR
jgi:hypothetical protein